MTTYLITGGTGSFGTSWMAELWEQRCKFGDTVRVFSRDEQKQAILRETFGDGFRYLIGDIRSKDRVYRALDGVDVVVHAAAMKSVPECENNPYEAVLTNITGTQNIIDAAIDCGVKKVLLISTDKAASPCNLYGATKLVAESLFTHANSYVGKHETRFATVRLGNLAGSRGSVVPIWQDAVGPLTITDPNMTRFWMTLSQAARFSFIALDTMEGGEIFVPYIPALRVGDLADAVRPGASWNITGARPGERRDETLITADEVPRTVVHNGDTGYTPCVTYATIHSSEMPAPTQFAGRFGSQDAPRMSIEEIMATL